MQLLIVVFYFLANLKLSFHRKLNTRVDVTQRIFNKIGGKLLQRVILKAFVFRAQFAKVGTALLPYF